MTGESGHGGHSEHVETRARQALSSALQPGEQLVHAAMVTARTYTPALERLDLLGAAAVTDRALILSLHPTVDPTQGPTREPRQSPDNGVTAAAVLDGRIDVGLVIGDPIQSDDGLEVTYRRPGLQPGRRTVVLNGLGPAVTGHFMALLNRMRDRRSQDVARIREQVASRLAPGDDVYVAVAVNSSLPTRGVGAATGMLEAFVALSHTTMFAGPFAPTADRPQVTVARELAGCWASPAEGGFRLVATVDGGELVRLLVPTDPTDWWLLQDFCDELAADE